MVIHFKTPKQVAAELVAKLNNNELAALLEEAGCKKKRRIVQAHLGTGTVPIEDLPAIGPISRATRRKLFMAVCKEAVRIAKSRGII